jgi:glutathione S-transferase
MFANSGKTHDRPIMWGGPASAFSARVRSYLIKRGIEYQEIFSNHPRFNAEILPAIGYFVVPVMELEDGTLIQDSKDVIAHFEKAYPDDPLTPETPVLKALDGLLSFFCTETFFAPGMHYRWNYMDRQKDYVLAIFGNFMSAVRDKEQQAAEVAPAMEYFSGFLPDLGVRPETVETIEESYEVWLKVLDAHLFQHPYIMGGRPGLADFGGMTWLYAHIARDPYSSDMMKRVAPHVFRWTERMHNQGIVDGEFYDVAPVYAPDDTPPETLLPVLEFLFSDCAPETIATIDIYNKWLVANPDLPARTEIKADPEAPSSGHPRLGEITFEQRGTTFRRQGLVSAVYHYQCMMDVIESLPADARAKFDALIKSLGGNAFLAAQPARRIKYENYRYLLT